MENRPLSFIISVLAIISCNPVIFQNLNSFFVLIFSLIYIVIFLKLILEKKATFNKEYIIVLFISIMIFAYIAIPFREYDRFSPSIIWLLLFPSLLFLNKNILINAFYYFTNLIYIICLFSLLVLILNVIGFQLPNIVIPREIGGYFTSYYISVKLSGQEYSLFGLQFYRLNGIFAEPGHFGLLLCMVLFAYKGILNSFKGKIILLTSLLTFSFGTFILIFGLLIKNILLEKKYYLAILIILLLGILVSVVPFEILERFFFDKAEGSLEDRTSNFFVVFYNSFIDHGNILTGGGRDILEINSIRNSDYRGFILRYGYLCLFFYLLLIFFLHKKSSKSIKFLVFFYFMIVFMHRSWFIDYFAFLFFILILTFNQNYKDISRNN